MVSLRKVKNIESLISETVIARTNAWDNMDFDACHRRTALQKFYSMTVTYFCKVKIWNVTISEIVRAREKWVEQLLQILIIAIEWCHCEWSIMWHSPISFEIKYLKCYHLQDGTFWYLPFNGAIPKVVLCNIDLLFQGQILEMIRASAKCQIWFL